MRTFKQVLRGIKDAEKDVDKVLRAARLQRNEKNSNIDWELIFVMVVLLIFFCMFALLILCS